MELEGAGCERRFGGVYRHTQHEVIYLPLTPQIAGRLALNGYDIRSEDDLSIKGGQNGVERQTRSPEE